MKAILALFLALPAGAIDIGPEPVRNAAISPATVMTSTLTVTGTNSGGNCLAVDGTTLVADCLNDRVGVGTASPDYTEHIVGGEYVTGQSIVGGSQTIRVDALGAGSTAQALQVSDNVGNTFQTYRVPTGVYGKHRIAPNTLELSLESVSYGITGGNVGIDTASPLAKLSVSGDASVSGASTFGSSVTVTNQMRVTPPSAETIAAGGVITADACGGLKQITAAGNVTTDLTNTITAPAADNAGCCMDIYNQAGGVTITLDANANNTLAADAALGPCDVVRACSQGAGGRWVFNAVYAGTCN